MNRHILQLVLIACPFLHAQELPHAEPVPVKTKKPQKLDGKELPVKEFLSILRYPQVYQSWVKMDGKIIHKGDGKIIKYPIALRGRFKSDSWRMQIQINQQERWIVRQTFQDGEFGTSKLQQKKPAESDRSLADMMIRPEDITLSFLYWDFVRELEPESVSMQRCRVLELKHPRSEERVQIWAAVKYFFPLQVKWFAEGQKESVRQLRFKGFTAIKLPSNPGVKLGFVKEVIIKGNGWRTMFEFKNSQGDAVSEKNPPPADLFIRDPAK